MLLPFSSFGLRLPLLPSEEMELEGVLRAFVSGLPEGKEKRNGKETLG